MNYPSKYIAQAVEEMSGLPGIGKRTALRLIVHLVNTSKQNMLALAESIHNLAENIKHCSVCGNISDDDICEICKNPSRNNGVLCVVEDMRDVLAIENTQQYKGRYHVLGGKISPMDGIGPEQLNLHSLFERVKNENPKELFLALSSTLEGDTTAFYIHKKLADQPIQFSTIARGIGVGDELEYTDEVTLGRSILNRIPYTEKMNSSV